MKTESYRQCLLRRNRGNTIEQQTSWIPSVFAVIGDTLKLKNKKGEWSDGWQVIKVSDNLSAYIVEANERNYLKQRAASDAVFSEIKKYNQTYNS